MTATIDTPVTEPELPDGADVPARRPGRAAGARTALASSSARAGGIARRLLVRARTFLAPVTALGWSVLAMAGVAYLVGWRLGWYEFMVIAAVLLLELLLAVPFLYGRALLDVTLEVSPNRGRGGRASRGWHPRGEHGSHAAAALPARAAGRRRSRAVRPAVVGLPTPRRTTSSSFDAPCGHHRRAGVHGARRPARSAQADRAVGAGAEELIIHPG
ncbi:MAG: hypothetical protein U0S36_06320 [Candidatus Nanopelagicales bacterium]